MSDFSGSVQIEMPKYKCHKEVWALKILKIEPSSGHRSAKLDEETDGDCIITPENTDYSPFKVDKNYIDKHQPQVGGYFVLYEDGYKSYSPAEAFESGYNIID